MDKLGYIGEMIQLGTIPAYLSLAIIAIFAFYVIWHSIRGYQRGVFKQLFHLLFVVIAIVVSYFATTYLWTISLSILDGYTIESLLQLFGVTLPENLSSAFAAFDMQVVEYIMLLPVGVIAMPFVFMMVFFVVNIVLKLFYVITVGLLKIPYAQSKASEIPGMLLGLVEGVLVASMILLPFADASDLANDAYVMMEETRDERGLGETDGEKFLAEYVVPLSSNPVLKAIGLLGAENLLNGFASFEDSYGVTNLRDEFASTVKLAFLDFASLHDADWMQLAQHHKSAIEDIVDSIEDSRYKTEILSEMLSCIGILLDASGSETGTDAKSDIILALFSVFDNLESNELDGVLDVFAEFYFHMSDEGILKAYENGDDDELVNLFTKRNAAGKTNLTVMTEILNKNERTTLLSSKITKLSISILSGGKGMAADAGAKYESVKGSVNNAIANIDASKPKDEQISDMSETIKTSMAGNGITIESEVADDMAKYIIDNHSGKTSLTDAEFDDALLYYYQAKKNYDDSHKTEQGGTPEGGTPEGGTPEGGTLEGGTPEGGTPESGTPEGGTPESGT